MVPWDDIQSKECPAVVNDQLIFQRAHLFIGPCLSSMLQCKNGSSIRPGTMASRFFKVFQCRLSIGESGNVIRTEELAHGAVTAQLVFSLRETQPPQPPACCLLHHTRCRRRWLVMDMPGCSRLSRPPCRHICCRRRMPIGTDHSSMLGYAR